MSESTDLEYLAWKAEKAERERKRGRYWLTPEGRELIREIWGHDDNDGATVAPLLNEVERLEAQRDELLAALKLVRQYGSHGETDDGMSVSYFVESAIAKAEGRS